jgi:hypothetical protein
MDKESMSTKYLTPQQINHELERMKYRHPAVVMAPFIHPFEGFQNVCLAIEFTVPNAYKQGEQQKQCVNVPVPPIVSAEHFHDWLLWRMQTIVLHETCEMYWLDGKAPMYDPHSETYWKMGYYLQ